MLTVMSDSNKYIKKILNFMPKLDISSSFKNRFSYFKCILTLISSWNRVNAIIFTEFFKHSGNFFNHDLNRGCLVYMFSLRFSGSKFLINLRRQFRVRKIFRTQVFAGFAVFFISVCKIIISKLSNTRN